MMEALKAITVYAAYQYFEEKEKGTIEKGKKGRFCSVKRKSAGNRTGESGICSGSYDDQGK